MTGTVLSVSQRGTVALQINQHTVNARTTLPLIAGQTLTLVVDKISPELRLRVLDQQLHASVLAQAVRMQLPRQGSVLELLAGLNRISKRAEVMQLPKTIVQMIRHITQGLTAVNESLSGEGVKQAVLNSGHFLERRILKMLNEYRDGVLARDFKAGLLRLRAALAEYLTQRAGNPGSPESGSTKSPRQTAHTPAPATSPGTGSAREPMQQQALSKLLQQVEAALARIQLHQLTTLSQQKGTRSAWIVDLPVRCGQDVQLLEFRIGKRRRRAEGANEEAFSVTFSVELEALGKIQSRISLSDGRISAILQTERDATATLVNRHLDELHQRLQSAGLIPETVACFHGIAKDDAATIETPLLDLRA